MLKILFLLKAASFCRFEKRRSPRAEGRGEVVDSLQKPVSVSSTSSGSQLALFVHVPAWSHLPYLAVAAAHKVLAGVQ